MLILKILIVLLLILLPLGEIPRFNFGNYIYIKPLEVIAVITLFWIIVLYIKNKSFRKTLHWYYFFFPLIGIISLGINSIWLKPVELLASFLYLLRWVAYMGIFFAVLQCDEKFRKQIYNFLLIDGIVFLLIGYFQFFFYQSLQNLSYLGWDRHEYRLVSSLFDPNYAGAFLVLFLVFLAGTVFNSKNKLKRTTIVFYSIISVITLVAVFLTYSRSALIMLLISGITFFVILNKKKYILYLTGVVVLFIIVISPFFYIENIDLFRLNSGLARLADMQHSVKIIADHPLLGVGFNAFRYAQIRYNFAPEVLSVPSNAASGVDTSILFVLATTGIIGLIAYGNLCVQLFKKAKSSANRYSLIFIVSGIGLVINSFFNNSLFYSEIMFWMWMIAGLMYAEK